MSPNVRALLAESLPVAVIVGFWTVVSWLAVTPAAGFAVRVTAVVSAGGYALVRGIARGRSVGPRAVPVSPQALVETNARLAVVLAPWLLLAIVVPSLASALDRGGFAGFGISPADSLAFAAMAIAATTALLAVASLATSWLLFTREHERAVTTWGNWTSD
jgi:hypothetical protein